MARNSLRGLYFWERDTPEENNIFCTYLKDLHYCLYNSPDQYRVYHKSPCIEDEELLISPKCMVTWK